MINIEKRIYGKDYADNIIDPLLAFDRTQAWTVSTGTGSAVLDNNLPFTGLNSLKIENTQTNTSDLTVTNSQQSTVIPYTGDFSFSLMLQKSNPLNSIRVDVNIFKNASILDTQIFTIGSDVAEEDTDDIWSRFMSSQNYALTQGDVITFSFTIKIDAAFPSNISTVWLDGLMLHDAKRISKISPVYVKPDRFKNLPDLPTADGNYGLNVTSGVYTWYVIP